MMKKIFTLIVLCMAAIGMQAQDSWTVTGSGTLLGSTWDVNDNSNNMAKNSDGLWELVKTDVSLEAGIGIEFKVAKNHSWDEAYPSSNYSFKVQETASYKVTITFDENSKAINVATEKSGSAVIGEKTWTVAGDEALMGSNWKPENAENDMQKQADGTYRLEKKGRTLGKGSYKFKVCANHGWDETYGSKNDDGTYGDYVMLVPEDGTYTVTITFDPATKEVVALTNLTTGIATVSRDSFTVNQIFDLNGCRVAQPKHGLYIINGKKVVIK